jgi:hypothetical protein
MRNLLVIANILASFVLLSQNIEIHQGPKNRFASNWFISEILTSDANGIMTIQQKRGLFRKPTYKLQNYDQRMAPLPEVEFELPDKDLEIQEFLYKNETVFIFFSKYDKDKNLNFLYGTTLNRNGQLNQNFFELAAVEADSKRKRNSFDINHSHDSTRFLVTVIPPYSKKENQQVHFLVLDHQFKEYDNIQIKFPYEDRDINLKDAQLDKDGNIHLLASVALAGEDGKRRGILADWDLRIFTYYKDDESFKEHKVTIGRKEEDTYLTQVQMFRDVKGRIHCSGFYSNNKQNSVKGLFTFDVDTQNKTITNIKHQDFTDEFINEFLNKRQQKKKQRAQDKGKNRYDELRNIVLRDFVLKSDGSFYFVAESYIYYVITTTDANGVTRTTHHYIYGDVLLADVKADNSVNWFARIPKYQHTTNDNGKYSGLSTSIGKNDELHVIFNDSKKNATVKYPEKLINFNLKNAITVLVSFDQKGDFSKTPLMPAKEASTILMPKMHYAAKPGDLILFATIRKDYRFINIRF